MKAKRMDAQRRMALRDRLHVIGEDGFADHMLLRSELLWLLDQAAMYERAHGEATYVHD